MDTIPMNVSLNTYKQYKITNETTLRTINETDLIYYRTKGKINQSQWLYVLLKQNNERYFRFINTYSYTVLKYCILTYPSLPFSFLIREF